MSDKPRLEFVGGLPDHALEQIADLLLTSQECFNCGAAATCHVDTGDWAGKHACQGCFQSLIEQEQER